MYTFPPFTPPPTPPAPRGGVWSPSPKPVLGGGGPRPPAAAEEMRRDYLAGCVGEAYPVLYEQVYDGRWQGHAPNYVRVAAASGEGLHNRVVMTRITGVEGDLLIGELIS